MCKQCHETHFNESFIEKRGLCFMNSARDLLPDTGYSLKNISALSNVHLVTNTPGVCIELTGSSSLCF